MGSYACDEFQPIFHCLCSPLPSGGSSHTFCAQPPLAMGAPGDFGHAQFGRPIGVPTGSSILILLSPFKVSKLLFPCHLGYIRFSELVASTHPRRTTSWF